MSKKNIPILLLFLALLPYPTLWAKKGGAGNFSLEIGQGVGYSNLNINPNNSSDLSFKIKGSWSTTTHFGINIFFIEYVGLSIGADFSRYGSTINTNGSQTFYNVTDNSEGDGIGELYNHTVNINNWKEKNQALLIEVPISLKFAIPVSNIYITAEIGAKWSQAIQTTYSANGEITHIGRYDLWDLTIINQPVDGFYTETNFKPNGKITGWNNPFLAFAKLGVAIPITPKFHVTAQLYGQYSINSFTNSQKNQIEPDLGFRNDRAGMTSAHYFMTDYSPITLTSRIKNNFHPLAIGLEIGIRYLVPFKNKQKYSCKCVKDNPHRK